MSGDESAKSPKKARPNFDPALVRELAALLDETGLTEIEVEEAGMRVRVGRQSAQVVSAPAIVAAPAPAAEPGGVAKRGTIVASPMVGTVYLGPQPGAAPFVKTGDAVKDGQTLIIIEAMKTMNQVPATAAGKIVEIYVQDGQPVEFGEPLMLID
jgi:acetyl-CoA carboxylase biotin carboxyl carrier protein